MLKVIGLKDKNEWKSLWNKLPKDQKSVYFLPEYYEIYEALGYGEALCAIFEKENIFYIYPFLKRSLKKIEIFSNSEELFDIEGAYGLNGVGTTDLSREFEKNFSTDWCEYCQNHKIVAEFVRFNPLFENHKYSSFLTSILANQVISVNLKVDDLMYESYEHSVRKNIKKAERAAVEIINFSSTELGESYLQNFLDIYYKTMDRNEATDFYYFKKEYFQLLIKLLPENVRWFFAIFENKVIAAELVLFDEENCYSFLGGTLPDYFSIGANVQLKNKIIHYFKNVGLKSFFLGGGLSQKDGIFKYKKTFAKNSEINFFIGKKIHLDVDYKKLVDLWESKYPEKKEKNKNILLKYWY